MVHTRRRILSSKHELLGRLESREMGVKAAGLSEDRALIAPHLIEEVTARADQAVCSTLAARRTNLRY
jgi:hypothetical protein